MEPQAFRSGRIGLRRMGLYQARARHPLLPVIVRGGRRGSLWGMLACGSSRADQALRHNLRMLASERAVVVAVCGSPGAGKTTVASATARRMGVPLLTRDTIKTGIALSSAHVADDSKIHFNPNYHIAGGPFSLRAETVMVNAARLFAAERVSFVVESSVLSEGLMNALFAADARVLAVHVVAREAVIGRRLHARVSDGRGIDQQLADLFRRGRMRQSLFEPPSRVSDRVQVDTSDGGEPDLDGILAAAAALLRQ